MKVSDSMKLITFQLPRGTGEFSIPEEWWIAAGMARFQRQADAYRTPPGVPPETEVRSVRLDDIAGLPTMEKRQHKMEREQRVAYGGLDKLRFEAILRRFVSNEVVNPVGVRNRQDGDFCFIINDGVHRYHASIAAGFTHIPAFIEWQPEVDVDEC
jgi:hypothetical protein